MTILFLQSSITTPGTTISTPMQFRDARRGVSYLTCQANCSIASTSGFAQSCTVSVDVQVSLDGSNFTDVMNFSYFSGTGGVSILTVNGGTPIAAPTPLTDGLTANTSQGGILGSLVRCKLQSWGTQSASIRVDAVSSAGLVPTS
jgi:hypothetical protein